VRQNYKNIIIPNADHSLEVSGDIQQSIKIMEEIVTEIQNFIDTTRSLIESAPSPRKIFLDIGFTCWSTDVVTG